MLHTKFYGNQPAGSGEDYYRVFTIYGHGGHLVHVTMQHHVIRFLFPCT